MKFRTNYRCLPILLWSALTAAAAEPASPANSETEPNFVGQVSERLLYDLVNTKVQQTTNVSENVLGTAVRGSVTTRGQVFPMLVPDALRGVLQLRFSGTSRSPGLVGRNGPATIYSSSVTNTDLWKTVIFDQQGIRDLPTVGNSQTQVSINDVAAKRRLVEFIARRRANGSRGQAAAITSARTKGQISKEIERGAKEPLATAHDYFVHSFQEPLLERGALPKLMRFSTTGDHLRLVMRQLGRSVMPPPTAMPELKTQHDLSFAFHESALNSLYEVFYAGETLRDKDFLNTMDTLTGEEQPQLRVTSKKPRWSITLADERPLDLKFADGGTAIDVHLKSLKLGERQFIGKLTISVRYQIEKAASGPQFNRDGEVQVNGQLDGASAAELDEAITLLKTKFSGVFLPVLTLNGLTVPSDDLWVKLGKLLLVQFDAKDGWLVAGYQLPRATPQPARQQFAGRPSAVRPTASQQTYAQPTASRQASSVETASQPTVSRQPASQQTARQQTAGRRLGAHQPVSHRPARAFGSQARRGGCH